MLYIRKISSDSVIDFAAEELKKYLRMMMPNGGDVRIDYDPSAKDCFKLGLMQDFDLDVSDVRDVELDDIIYIDADGDGGVIAGDNPRSVLLAVYEFLRQNGCRWLFPGVDGEYIPLKAVGRVKYRHAPSCRYRGPCIEGATSQRVLLETIDFLPKVGMNLFMMQFFLPTPFYMRSYEHRGSMHRAPEPVTEEQMLQWKTACECEIAKRGIEFHDVGHGWTAAPFGINCTSGWDAVDDDTVPDEAREFLAMVNGERRLYEGKVLNTQFCLSNPEARRRVASYIAEYSAVHSNVDYIHVWLGDNYNNHCECPECRTKDVSDWYVILLNEIDAALAEKNLPTRIVFIAYTETTWAPVRERIANPDRFTLMLAPITRSYTHSLDGSEIATVPFERNKVTLPRTLDEYIAYYKDWRGVYDGAALAFEYHFWKHQIRDISGISLARRIYDDAEAYKSVGVDGMIACGSQRSYFPNGFAYYVFARKQFDLSLSFEEIRDEYYSSAYGEDWQSFYAYLSRLDEAFGFSYLEFEESADENISKLYNPERARILAGVPEIIAEGRELIRAHYNSPHRVVTASVRILEEHAAYAEAFARALREKAIGNDAEAVRLGEELLERASSVEDRMELYFDYELATRYVMDGLRQTGKPDGEIDSM